MKKVPLLTVVILLLAQVTVAFAQELPPVPREPVNGYVVDELNWLSIEQEKEINSIVQSLDDDGIAEIGVLTRDECGSDAKRYRYEVFNQWGIGHANRNDGLLIAVCWYGGDKNRRTVEQETGYGLEGVLPDTLTNKVAKEVFRPYFADNKPGDGLVQMVKTYDAILRGNDHDIAINKSLSTGGYQNASETQQSDLGTLLWTPFLGLACIWWILILIVVILIIVLLFGGDISGGGGGYYYSGGSSGGSSSDSGGSFGGGDSGGGGSSTGF